MAIFYENIVHLLRFAASYCVRFVPFIIMFYLMRVCWTTILHLASAGDIYFTTQLSSGFKIDCYHLIRKTGGSQDFDWIRRTLFCVNIDTQLWNTFCHPKICLATQESIVFVKSADQTEITSFNTSMHDLPFNIFRHTRLFECNLKVTYLPMLSNNQSDFGWQGNGNIWLFSEKIL